MFDTLLEEWWASCAHASSKSERQYDEGEAENILQMTERSLISSSVRLGVPQTRVWRTLSG